MRSSDFTNTDVDIGDTQSNSASFHFVLRCCCPLPRLIVSSSNVMAKRTFSSAILGMFPPRGWMARTTDVARHRNATASGVALYVRPVQSRPNLGRPIHKPSTILPPAQGREDGPWSSSERRTGHQLRPEPCIRRTRVEETQSCACSECNLGVA